MRRLSYATVLIILLPLAANAAARTFSELANQLVVLIDSAVIVLVVAAVVIYLANVAVSTQKAKNEGGKKLRTYALYGIGILFVMVSVWGIIQILQNSLFGTSGASGSQNFQSGFSPPSFGL